MFKNYFKTAYRNILKDKTSSLISIMGLAIGMACCILILIHVKDELTYNKFNDNLNNIYRINWTVKTNDRTDVYTSSPIPFSKNLTAKIPGIEKLAKIFQRTGQMETDRNDKGDKTDVKRFQEQSVYFVDQEMFKIFSIPFIGGDKNTALSAPNTIVITDEMATKYFGTVNPIGKLLLYDSKVVLQVVGIVKKMPANSDLKFDFLISFETIYHVENQAFADYIKNSWTFSPCDTWVLLKEGQSAQNIEQSLIQHLIENGTPRNHKLNSVRLQPFKKVHLYASDVIGNPSTSSITYVYIFIGIAFLILLIANVNFINLSIARSINRIKEVGLRKVLGAEKKQLIIQFLCSSLLVCLVAFVLAVILTEIALPALNRLTNKQFTWRSWVTIPNFIFFSSIFFITGILAGLYPAFFITRFKTALALKGKSGDQSKRNFVQKSLLIIQFTISIILIIGAIVIFQQMQYLRNKPLGFQKQQMLVVPLFGKGATGFTDIDSSMSQHIKLFSDELSTLSKIKSVTAASEMPGQGFTRIFSIPEGLSEHDETFVSWLSVEYNFIQALNIQLVAGRNFSKNNGTDLNNGFIVNEAAVRAYGWKNPENAIGKTFIRGKKQYYKKGQIIGVIKDFDFNSLNNPMEPLLIDLNPARLTQFAISIQPDHINETIERIKQTWNKIFPERGFDYSFLDKDIDNQYKDKENFSRMIEYFALAAILLCCSGLFGLALFIALKRTKEIGIRKVLGANSFSIVVLLSADFIKLVLVAALMASPVAWWLVHSWLQGFAYHVTIAWWVFVLATFLAVLITFITISVQSIKVALANPVKSLKSD